MKTGKLSESVLKRSVLKRIKVDKKKFITPPGVGRDATAIGADEDDIIVTATGAYPDVKGDYVSYPLVSAINNIAASGAEPFGVMVTGFLPEDMEEAGIKGLSDSVDELCRQLDIQAMGGHTQVTAAVDRPIISVTALGKAKKEKLLSSAGAKPGDDIVVTKWIGLAGTAILATEEETIIADKLKQGLINDAKHFSNMISILPEAKAAASLGVHAMHDLSQGGIYNGLWEMAQSSKVGLTIDIKKIPIRQETVEICEIFDINPYRMLSGGSLLIAHPDGQALVDELAAKEIPSVVIGRFTDSNDRIIMNEDEITYLDSPKQEELLKK